MGDPELEIGLILLGEAGNAQLHPREIDALVRREHAAHRDTRRQPVVPNGEDLERQAAVIKQEPVTFVHRFEQLAEVHRNVLTVARRRLGVPVEQDHLLALCQLQRRRQLSHADLRSLQVLENADGATGLLRHAPDGGDDLRMLLVGAVREIQTCDVQAGGHQPLQCLLVPAGGTDRGDDLGSAHTVLLYRAAV